MKYKVRFSEGNDQDWQEICEKAVELGYAVNIAVPDVIVLDTLTKVIKQSVLQEPNVNLGQIREVLGLVGEPVEELEGVEEETPNATDAELEGETIIEDGTLSVVTASTKVTISKTDLHLRIEIQ